jgi:hypothetical protein
VRARKRLLDIPTPVTRIFGGLPFRDMERRGVRIRFVHWRQSASTVMMALIGNRRMLVVTIRTLRSKWRAHGDWEVRSSMIKVLEGQ